MDSHLFAGIDMPMMRFGKIKHIHFVGIGGIGMSGIAELLFNLGYMVSGSDLRETGITRRLARLGIPVFKGHHKKNIIGADVVVYSSAVTVDNPEVSEAKALHVPVIPRGEMLAELMRLKYGVAIAGMHGKTTTTSMVASILTHAHLDPTVIIGGRLDMWGGSNSKLGEGDILVAEADESDGSFLSLFSAISVVTNIDHEHMEYYGSMETVRQAFVNFINKVPFYGTAVLCLDDEEIQGIIPRLKKRYVTYGMAPQADLVAANIKKQGASVCFDVFYRNRPMAALTVGMPGEHNVLNALAATAVALELDVPVSAIKTGLEEMGGLERRLQVKGEVDDILVLDDYGHHPTEIVATLKAVRECWDKRRLFVVFQPHRFTRTQALFNRFVLSFNAADTLMVLPIYPASEKPIPGVSSEVLVKGIKDHGHKDVLFCRDETDAVSHILSRVKPGDMVMTLGAGSINRLGSRLIDELEKRRVTC